MEPLDHQTANAAVATTLARLSSAARARDAAAIEDLFDDTSLLIGTSGHATNGPERRAYIEAVVNHPAALTWEWQEVVVRSTDPDSILFLALGTVVLTGSDAVQRNPIRLTGVLRPSGSAGWRFAQFHGSIPAT